jgi:hypothetical protein
MTLKGASYDAGRVLGMNWRPVFDPDVVHREAAMIKADLHCKADLWAQHRAARGRRRGRAGSRI